MPYIPHIQAAQGNIKFHNAPITFDASTALGDETYGSSVHSCKNMSLDFPKSDAEIVQLIGQTSKTVGAGIPATGTFQNAVLDIKAWGQPKFTATLVFTSDETNVPDFLRIVSGTGAAISTTYRRHTFGDSNTNQSRVTNGALLCAFNNGSETTYAVLNNFVANWGQLKPTGTDGHFEVDIEATCLPEDCVADVKI